MEKIFESFTEYLESVNESSTDLEKSYEKLKTFIKDLKNTKNDARKEEMGKAIKKQKTMNINNGLKFDDYKEIFGPLFDELMIFHKFKWGPDNEHKLDLTIGAINMYSLDQFLK